MIRTLNIVLTFTALLALIAVYVLFVVLRPDTFARAANLVTMARQTVVVGMRPAADETRRVQASIGPAGGTLETVDAAGVVIRPNFERNLMLSVDYVVWEGQPGAMTRVVLPLSVGFNVLLYKDGRGFWPWFVGGNLLLVASGSGTTSGVVKSAETASKAGARIAAFTTNPDSPLARLAA